METLGFPFSISTRVDRLIAALSATWAVVSFRRFRASLRFSPICCKSFMCAGKMIGFFVFMFNIFDKKRKIVENIQRYRRAFLGESFGEQMVFGTNRKGTSAKKLHSGGFRCLFNFYRITVVLYCFSCCRFSITIALCNLSPAPAISSGTTSFEGNLILIKSG